ncbi:MAG: hypothetical protein ACU0A5_05995 [Salipiger marinus]|uniref:hypothetical protein n=1 Tax=Salipiger marinus TaxID=555512 RepID=UPI004058F612
MIDRIFVAVLALGLLAGCGDGNPLSGSDDSTETDPDTGNGTGDNSSGDSDGSDNDGTTDPIDSDGGRPPGTANPMPSTAIVRYEEDDGEGNGMIRSPAYNSADDTFYVDNLAFDGTNNYLRDNQVPSLGPIGSLGPFAVYENEATVRDPVNGQLIPQLRHKAIYAVSESGNTELAIVRTGDFVGYGFGGFVYQRNGGVTLPETGQAVYNGDYAAIRDFDGSGGLEYATGDARVQIDFEDYNSGAGVYGTVTNRRIYDTAGTDVTSTYLDALATEYGGSFSDLPVVQFRIGPGVTDANGEMVGEAYSTVAGEGHETGSFYAVLSDGDDGAAASEIVGVIVVESPFGDVTVRETGGFLVSR